MSINTNKINSDESKMAIQDGENRVKARVVSALFLSCKLLGLVYKTVMYIFFC